MKKLIVAMLMMVPFAAVADTDFHEVRGLQVIELTVSTPAVASEQAWRYSLVRLAAPGHGIQACNPILRVENDDASLIEQLRDSLNEFRNGTTRTADMIIEDTLPGTDQAFCLVRRMTVR